MKDKMLPAFILMAAAVLSFAASADAELRNGARWLDTNGVMINAHGGALMKDGATWWWYGEHKTAGKEGNKAWVGVHAYSSTNLLAWTDRGIVFSVEKPNGSDADVASPGKVEPGCILERPKVAKAQDGSRYVMYFHLEPKGAGYSGALTGIAEAPTPEGPFALVWTGRPTAGTAPVNASDDTSNGYEIPQPWGGTAKLWRNSVKGGQMSRDMTLFTDPASGIVYHVFASENNSCLHIAELRPDGLGYTGKWARLTPGDWTEAPALVKHGDWYFLLGSGCTGWRANAARYYRAKSVWGPWERMENPCRGKNAELTWGGQSTGIFEANGTTFAMFDLWRPSNAIDGRYVWLPIQFNDRGEMKIDYRETFTPTLAPPWEDPIVTEINRLPARTTLRPADASHVLSLDGTWNFTFVNPPAPGRENVPEERRVGTIVVPSCWQLAAKNPDGTPMTTDPPLYVNIKYPFANDPPRVTTAPTDKRWTSWRYRIPYGIYTKRVTLPAAWSGRRVILRLNGYSSAVYVKVNGETVGYGEDGRLANEFDLTRFTVSSAPSRTPARVYPPAEGCLRSKSLEWCASDTVIDLELTVLKHCDGSYLEDQDFWRLSGLFRSVELVSEPLDGLFDFNVTTRVSAGGVGIVGVNARFYTESVCARARTLRTVRALADSGSGAYTWKLFDDRGDERLRGVGGAELTLPDVHLWSREDPYLYTLRVTCAGETYVRKIGFRTVTIDDGVLKLNGERLLIHGVNRHEMSPTGGYAMTRSEMEKDIATMKRFNIDAVRTSHYANDPYWYELCDASGIVVVAECNVECHGSGHPLKTTALTHHPDWRKVMIERNLNNVAVLRDHPSIIGWSLGNESGTGKNMADAYTAVKAADPTRFVQYEGIFNPYGALNFDVYGSDVICPMYEKPAAVAKAMEKGFAKPYILCEYAHAMGNSSGNLDEYWDLVDKYPRFQGGFIWDFADQALWKKEEGKRKSEKEGEREYLAYGGDFGDVPGERNGHCNGLFDAFRQPHPGAYEVAYFYGGRKAMAYEPAAGTRDACPYHAPNLQPSTFNPKLSFWRAPTDNDRGNKLASKSACWRAATEEGLLPAGVTTNLVVTAIPDGCEYDLTVNVPAGVPEVPRVGLEFVLPGTPATRVAWQGAGPWENYADRAASAAVGDYAMSVAELDDSHYVRPQECGHRTKTTRLAVGDYTFTALPSPSTSNLQPSTFEWNVLPWSTAALEAAEHAEDLPAPEGTLHVFIDAVHRGVGGDDSWGAAVHPQYRHEGARTYRLRFSLTRPGGGYGIIGENFHTRRQHVTEHRYRN